MARNEYCDPNVSIFSFTLVDVCLRNICLSFCCMHMFVYPVWCTLCWYDISGRGVQIGEGWMHAGTVGSFLRQEGLRDLTFTLGEAASPTLMPPPSTYEVCSKCALWTTADVWTFTGVCGGGYTGWCGWGSWRVRLISLQIAKFGGAVLRWSACRLQVWMLVWERFA